MENRAPIARDSCLASVAGTYREWHAVGPLAGYLACTWMNALPESATPLVLVRVIPDGCVDIIWTGENLRVAGPDTGPMFESFPPGTVIVGARFRPGAAPPWLGVPAPEIVNRRLPLQEFWGADARRLADQLQEVRDPRRIAELMLSALISRRPRPSLVDATARAVVDAFEREKDGRVHIGELTATLGLSERTLRRRCESAFGYGPKTLERILRFQQFLRLLRRSTVPGLAELAAASGFADQPHLTREVRRLGGLTPAGFMAQLAA